MKAEIKKIVLDLGGKEISLSLKQAKQLNTILGELFDVKSVTAFPYPTPIIIERSRPYWTYKPYIWTSGDVQMSYTTDDSAMSVAIGE
jgi:hypothetical protein